jgi:hypothetical protein
LDSTKKKLFRGEFSFSGEVAVCWTRAMSPRGAYLALTAKVASMRSSTPGSIRQRFSGVKRNFVILQIKEELFLDVTVSAIGE